MSNVLFRQVRGETPRTTRVAGTRAVPNVELMTPRTFRPQSCAARVAVAPETWLRNF